MVVLSNMWFTDLLHICDNISHLQTELVIMFLRKVKQNHCFCCERMCVCVGSGGGGAGQHEEGLMGGGKRRKEVNGMHYTSSNMYCDVCHVLSNVHMIPIIELIVTNLSALFPYHPLWDGFCMFLPVSSQCLSVEVAFWAPGGGSWT